jgi:hypothetical protein
MRVEENSLDMVLVRPYVRAQVCRRSVWQWVPSVSYDGDMGKHKAPDPQRLMPQRQFLHEESWQLALAVLGVGELLQTLSYGYIVCRLRQAFLVLGGCSAMVALP